MKGMILKIIAVFFFAVLFFRCGFGFLFLLPVDFNEIHLILLPSKSNSIWLRVFVYIEVSPVQTYCCLARAKQHRPCTNETGITMKCILK